MTLNASRNYLTNLWGVIPLMLLVGLSFAIFKLLADCCSIWAHACWWTTWHLAWAPLQTKHKWFGHQDTLTQKWNCVLAILAKSLGCPTNVHAAPGTSQVANLRNILQCLLAVQLVWPLRLHDRSFAWLVLPQMNQKGTEFRNVFCHFQTTCCPAKASLSFWFSVS